MNTLLVVGGSLAGLRGVQAARADGFDGRLLLVGAEPHLPYDRPPLSKEFLALHGTTRYFTEEAHLRDDLGVELRLGVPARALDPVRRTVQVGDEDLPYDALLIATGSAPRPLPRIEPRDGVLTLRTLDDAHRLRTRLTRDARVVIAGAGFIGSEIASAARAHGARVTVVEASATPLERAAGPEVGGALAGLHRRHGTDLRLGTTVTAVHGTGRVEGVRLSDGTELAADVLVVGIGAAPATGWLLGSGVRLHADGGVVCDGYLQTTVPGVYAAGDVVHWPNPLMDLPLMRCENWTAAAEQGAAAARNAVRTQGRAEVRTPFETVPYVWSDWYGQRIQFVGRPADDCRVVLGDLDGPTFLALYRAGERVVGAVALNQPGKIMKYRRLIAGRGTWAAALDLYPTAA
ncbi:NAD(P)/FAD-dependent oxidoreductase [Spongisporangium articulatum]|uniref:NAD(P)/FAD-dependent oxidoreductase n=1 Tax=Spongisporangium articulatum TaxID=3362603 RepID=A0ABW8ATK0_9ACTN